MEKVYFRRPKQQKRRVRLAGPGHQVFILKIRGSNPLRGTRFNK